MKKGLFALAGAVTGALGGIFAVNKLQKKVIDEKIAKADKFKGYYNILNQWLRLKQESKSLEKYFVDNNYKTIAIYGMGELGNRLFMELKDTNIKVRYAVDQNADETYSDLEIISKEDNFLEVDAIIVTAIFAFDEIEEELAEKTDYKILSLEEVINGVL